MMKFTFRRLNVAILIFSALFCSEVFAQDNPGSMPLAAVQSLESEPVLVQATPVVAHADEFISDELAALRKRLNELEGGIQQLNYQSTPQGEFVSSCCDMNAPCSSCCCEPYEAQFSVQSEVLFLRPSVSGINPIFNVAPGSGQFIDPTFEPATRHVIELWPAKSFGIRGRYFHYDHSSPFQAPFQPAKLGIDLDSADLEAVIRHQACQWEADFSAGVEYGRLSYSSSVATATGVGHATFEGVGAVLGVNGQHQIGQTPLSIYGGIRSSFLFGDIRNAALLVNTPRAKIHDEIMQVYNTQLGLAWKPDVIENGTFAVRAGWETQFWLNDTLADDSFGIGSNLGMTGPTISAELTY